MNRFYRYVAIFICMSFVIGSLDGISVRASGVSEDKDLAIQSADEAQYPDIPTVTGAAVQPTSTPYVLTKDEQEKVDEFEEAKTENLRCKLDAAKKVRLRWKRVKHADYYAIYRSDEKKGEYEKIDTTLKTKYTDRSAKGRRDYFYRVVAVWYFHEKVYQSRLGKRLKVYVMPKKPRTVIAGECFVEDFAMLSGYWPQNVHLVYKIGVNTYTMQHNNYFEYNGNTVTGIEKIATYNPDRVYFLIGANESAWVNPEWTMNNYTQMIKLLRSRNKHIQIVLIGVPPFGWSSTQNIPTEEKRNSYNVAYERYADERDYVYFCPATYVLEDGTGHLSGSYDGGDGCHWNEIGASRVAEEVRSWSRKTFGNW